MAKLPSINIPGITAEQYTLGLLTVSPPLIGLLWFDWRAGLTAFLITQIAIGLVRLRYS